MATQTMVYQWRDTFRGRRVDPQPVGERLEQLRDIHGQLPASVILDDGRDADSPLHPLFTWDDGEAAEQWRLREARDIAGSLVAVIEEAPDLPPIRAFAPIDTGDRERSYEPLRVILNTPDWRAQMLANAKAELRACRVKYGHLKELDAVWRLVAGLEEAA